MRTRDIKINRRVVFNKSFLKTNTINPTYANHVYKIVDMVNLPTSILVFIRSITDPKVGVWISSSHVEVAKEDSTNITSSTHVDDQQLTIKKGDVVAFNKEYDKALGNRFHNVHNFNHIARNTHIVQEADEHMWCSSTPNRDCVKIGCWWLPRIWFFVVKAGAEDGTNS